MTIILTTNLSPDDSCQTSCNVYAKRDGKLLMIVHTDYSMPRHSMSYSLPLDAHAFDDVPHQEIALILYNASMFIDDFFNERSEINEKGEWIV